MPHYQHLAQVFVFLTKLQLEWNAPKMPGLLLLS